MNYDLVGVSEILTAVTIFGVLAILGWRYATRKDISDDTRMFR